MDPKYATALAAAAASQANLGGSPNGNSGDVQHLQNMAQLQFGAGASKVGMGALAGGAQNAADIADAQRKMTAQAADNEAQKAELARADKAKYDASMNDPKNYQRVASDDGGWNFFKPDGTPITAKDYASARGEQLDKALAGSNNPNDQQFTRDYKTLMTYGRAMAGDQDALKKFKESDDGKAFLADPNNKNQTYAEVVKNFQTHYSSYLPSQQLNNMPATNAQGQNVTADAVDSGDPNFFSNWLKLYQRNGVNYR